MKPLSQFSAAVLIGLAAPVPAATLAKSLVSQATVTKAEATRIALHNAKGGDVRSVELEREHGTLVWSFDIARAGAEGTLEVQVDAKSGAIVSRKRESAAAEAREARTERAEAHKP